MSEFKRLAVPRELWRAAMPNAPERVIRALETLSDYYDGEEARTEIITNEIYLSSGSGTASLEQIQQLASAINDLQLETALASTLPIAQQEQDDEETLRSSPELQAAAQFLASATPVTFTPVVVGLTTAGVGTYGYQIGSGQLIGNRFEFSVSVGWSAHTGTGLIRIDGLPLPANSASNKVTSVSVVAENLTFAGQLAAYILPSESGIRLGQITSGAALAGVAIDTSAAVHITGSYEV